MKTITTYANYIAKKDTQTNALTEFKIFAKDFAEHFCMEVPEVKKTEVKGASKKGFSFNLPSFKFTIAQLDGDDKVSLIIEPSDIHGTGLITSFKYILQTDNDEKIKNFDAIYSNIKALVHAGWKETADSLIEGKRSGSLTRAKTGIIVQFYAIGMGSFGFSASFNDECMATVNIEEAKRILDLNGKKDKFWLIDRTSIKPFYEFHPHIEAVIPTKELDDKVYSVRSTNSGKWKNYRITKMLENGTISEIITLEEEPVKLTLNFNSDLWAIHRYLSWSKNPEKMISKW
jgi:hypothetical protein